MKRCKRCGSYAINQHLHGREYGKDRDLCDVCYWRKRAEYLFEAAVNSAIEKLDFMIMNDEKKSE
jgi:hypothetical protein